MKKFINVLLFSVLAFNYCFAQSIQKTTFQKELTKLSEMLNLELSYSTDLVTLNDSTNSIFSSKADSCIVQIERLANLRITKQDGHLVILPAPSKIIHLHGLVVDSKTKEPLPFAYIQIKNAGTGTVTNTDGKFDFKISGKYAGYKIEISFLGYKQYTFQIPAVNEDSLLIEMDSKPYTLSDVFVLPNGTEAVDLVKRAVKNIKRNYHRKAVQMDAFYRNTGFRDSMVTQLIEAALLIEDKGINMPSETTSIKLQQVRKSTNYVVPWDKKYEVFDKVFGHFNIFYLSYRNTVRDYQTDGWYKPLTDYETFKYEFEGYEWFDSVKVYKIGFIRDVLWPDGSRSSERKLSDIGGYIYINANDWGILKVEGWWRLMGERAKWGVKDGYFSKREIAYQKIDDKYYLKYIRDLSPPNGVFHIYENPEAPDNEKIVKECQWAEMVLLVTNVITERKEFDKIKYREKLARDENSYKKNYPYDPVFWANYNILKANPVQKKAIQDLEWEKPLEQQFKENSSNHAENK